MVTGMRLVARRVGVALGLFALAAGAAGAEDTIRVGLSYGQGPRSVVISGKGKWEARRFSEEFEGEARVTAGRGEVVLEASGQYALLGQILTPSADVSTEDRAWLARYGETREPLHVLQAEIDANGSFVIPHIPPGTYQLSVAHANQRIVVPWLALEAEP